MNRSTSNRDLGGSFENSYSGGGGGRRGGGNRSGANSRPPRKSRLDRQAIRSKFGIGGGGMPRDMVDPNPSHSSMHRMPSFGNRPPSRGSESASHVDPGSFATDLANASLTNASMGTAPSPLPRQNTDCPPPANDGRAVSPPSVAIPLPKSKNPAYTPTLSPSKPPRRRHPSMRYVGTLIVSAIQRIIEDGEHRRLAMGGADGTTPPMNPFCMTCQAEILNGGNPEDSISSPISMGGNSVPKFAEFSDFPAAQPFALGSPLLKPQSSSAFVTDSQSGNSTRQTSSVAGGAPTATAGRVPKLAVGENQSPIAPGAGESITEAPLGPTPASSSLLSPSMAATSSTQAFASPRIGPQASSSVGDDFDMNNTGVHPPPMLPPTLGASVAAAAGGIGGRRHSSSSPEVFGSSITPRSQSATMSTPRSPQAPATFPEGQDLLTFILNIHKHVRMDNAEPMIFVAAMVYLARIARSGCCHHTRIDRQNSYRLAVVAIMTATKLYLENHSLTINKRFSLASGIPLPELNKLEIEFLHLCDFFLLIEESDFVEYVFWLEEIAERTGHASESVGNWVLEKPAMNSSVSSTSGMRNVASFDSPSFPMRFTPPPSPVIGATAPGGKKHQWGDPVPIGVPINSPGGIAAASTSLPEGHGLPMPTALAGSTSESPRDHVVRTPSISQDPLGESLLNVLGLKSHSSAPPPPPSVSTGQLGSNSPVSLASTSVGNPYRPPGSSFSENPRSPAHSFTARSPLHSFRAQPGMPVPSAMLGGSPPRPPALTAVSNGESPLYPKSGEFSPTLGAMFSGPGGYSTPTHGPKLFSTKFVNDGGAASDTSEEPLELPSPMAIDALSPPPLPSLSPGMRCGIRSEAAMRRMKEDAFGDDDMRPPYGGGGRPRGMMGHSPPDHRRPEHSYSSSGMTHASKTVDSSTSPTTGGDGMTRSTKSTNTTPSSGEIGTTQRQPRARPGVPMSPPAPPKLNATQSFGNSSSSMTQSRMSRSGPFGGGDGFSDDEDDGMWSRMKQRRQVLSPPK